MTSGLRSRALVLAGILASLWVRVPAADATGHPDGEGIKGATVVDTEPFSDRVDGSYAAAESACTVGRIAFVRDFPRRARSDIYSISPNGSGMTKLTQNGDAWSPAWSPDGRVAYEDWSDGDGEIKVMDADGSNVVRSPTTRSRTPPRPGRRTVNGSPSLAATTSFRSQTSTTSTRYERTDPRSPS